MFDLFGKGRIYVPLSSLYESELRTPPALHERRLFAGYLRNLAKILDHSPTGRILFSVAADRGMTAGLDPLLEPSGSFFYALQNHFDLGYQPDILQKSEKGISRALVSVIGALRRGWHHHHGTGPDLQLKPRDFVTQYRVLEADAEALTHLIAWELRGAGLSFLWRHLLSSANGDMTIVFENSVMNNPRCQFDGTALRSVFNQWFADHARISAADHMALEMIDMGLLEPTVARNIGLRSLSSGQIEKTGIAPDGSNYLAGCVFSKAWYRGIEDEFNLTHLRHIETDVNQLLENHK